MGLFNNAVGYLGLSRQNAPHFAVFKRICSETEVFKQR
jgi:hypothetical protein